MSRVLKTGKNQITQSFECHGGFAKGIDIVKQTSQADAIVAHSAGKVIKVMNGQTNGSTDNEGFGYGNYVMLMHDDYYVTMYAHLDKVYVKKGDYVAKGQEIGYMGNTGNSFGIHLHFEVRKYNINPILIYGLHNTGNFVFVNPTPYIDGDLPYVKTEVTATDKYWRVQTGAFMSRQNAINLANELRSKKFDAIIKLYDGMYHVQVGAYKNKLYAIAYSLKLKLAGYATFITDADGKDILF